MMTKLNGISVTQLDCLRHVVEWNGIKRTPGGFWVRADFSGDPRHTKHFGTTTIDACRVRGWIEPVDGDDVVWKRVHKITDDGMVKLDDHKYEAPR